MGGGAAGGGGAMLGIMLGIMLIMGAGATMPGTGVGGPLSTGAAVGFSSERTHRPARQLNPGSQALVLVHRQASAPTMQVGAEVSQAISPTA